MKLCNYQRERNVLFALAWFELCCCICMFYFHLLFIAVFFECLYLSGLIFNTISSHMCEWAWHRYILLICNRVFFFISNSISTSSSIKQIARCISSLMLAETEVLRCDSCRRVVNSTPTRFNTLITSPSSFDEWAFSSVTCPLCSSVSVFTHLLAQ